MTGEGGIGPARPVALLNALDTWRDEVWFPDARTDGPIRPGWTTLREPGEPHRPALEESLRRLRERWSSADLSRSAAELYFDPASWCPEASRYHAAPTWVTLTILEAVLLLHPPADVFARIERRLQALLERPFDETSDGVVRLPPQHYEPSVGRAIGLLLALPQSEAGLDLIERIVTGDLDTDPIGPYPPVFEGWQRPYEILRHDLQTLIPELWRRLFDAGRFSYQTFRAAATHLPEIMAAAGATVDSFGRPVRLHVVLGPPFSATVLRFAERLATEVADSLQPKTAPLVRNAPDLRGGRYLVAAVRADEALGLGRLTLADHEFGTDVHGAVLRLARAKDVEPRDQDERQRLVAALRALPAASLQAVLPVALRGRRMVLEALGWEAAGPLVEQVVQLACLETARGVFDADVRNSTDPTAGGVDLPAARQAIALAGDTRARCVLDLYGKARVGAENVAYLLEAVGGWNRYQVEDSVGTHRQLAIKAYGLLPLDAARPATDTLQRYIRLQECAREARTYGSQRQANQEAAVRVGLTNLAQLAGYADAERLEWAMEARLGREVAPVGQRWDVDAYEVHLRLDPQSAEPELAVLRAGAALKSVPETVRRSTAYKTARQAQIQLRRQLTRFRAALEALLASGDILSPSDLDSLIRLPVARALVERLIFSTERGDFGLPAASADGDASAPLRLRGPGGEVSIGGGVVIAHPYGLFRTGQLAAWQRYVVEERIVQPFKQAFRELYLLTPAERETGTFSNRFAGHTVDARVAARLFQARAWRMDSGEITVPFKRFPRAGLEAAFEFPDSGHFLSETEAITSDRISFRPLTQGDSSWSAWRPDRAVPLADVPPLVFSETMRDADLVVSVAQRSGEVHLSAEGYQKRAELIRALLQDLGLQGVRTDGHFAHVEGSLARYRVHLGSAAIHIEPGNYLCIVPDRWGRRHESLFLPFADEGDGKLSEVISKVLLLLEDDKIKDASILNQIRAAI